MENVSQAARFPHLEFIAEKGINPKKDLPADLVQLCNQVTARARFAKDPAKIAEAQKQSVIVADRLLTYWENKKNLPEGPSPEELEAKRKQDEANAEAKRIADEENAKKQAQADAEAARIAAEEARRNAGNPYLKTIFGRK